MIHQYINLLEIAAGDTSGLEPGERDEAIKQFARGLGNLAALPTTERQPTPAEDRWLTPDEACTKYPIKRRWLFKHRLDLPFVRNDNRKTMWISEQGLRRWFGRRSS